jgi:ribulose kinase
MEDYMAVMTREAIRQVLGPVGDSLAAELVGTGATQAELRDAYAWITNDEALVNEMRHMPSGRVAQLIEILEQLNSHPVEE